MTMLIQKFTGNEISEFKFLNRALMALDTGKNEQLIKHHVNFCI